MRYLLLLLVVLTGQAMAVEQSARVVSSTSNVPTSFSTAAGSRILTNTVVTSVDGILVYNGGAQEIAVNCPRTLATPSDTSNANIYVPAATGIAIDDAGLGLVKYCFIRSMGTAISSATATTIVIKGLR